MRYKIGKTIMHLFRERGRGGRDSLYLDNPNHGATYKWYPWKDEPREYYCCVLNSESPSDQVWLGRRDKWFIFYGGSEFRKMALWVLWRWAWGDWFGLKTELWLIGLHMCVKGRTAIHRLG
jgi:hypothetical protein